MKTLAGELLLDEGRLLLSSLATDIAIVVFARSIALIFGKWLSLVHQTYTLPSARSNLGPADTLQAQKYHLSLHLLSQQPKGLIPCLNH